MSAVTRSPPARVSALRTVSLVLAFTAAVGLIFGTAGFSAMEADRGLDVSVSNDTSAYLGYEEVNDTVRDGEPKAIVEYRNQFGSDLDEFDVEVSSDHDDVTVVSPPETLGEGSKRRIALTIRCDAETDVTLQFDAEGSGDGVSVSLDRIHTVTCVPKGPSVTGVRYMGVGNAFVDVEEQNATIEAIVWLTDANPGKRNSDGTLRSKTISNIDTAQPVRPQIASNVSNQRIAAIEFPEQGTAVFHPGWNGEKHADPREGEGIRVSDSPLDGDTVSNTSVIDD